MITRYKDKLNIPKNVPAGDKEKFEKYVKKAYGVNKKFWKIDVAIKIKPVYSRADFDKQAGYKTKTWNCAFTSDQKIIVIFAPSVFERLTSHKLSGYLQTLIHEMNHIFYMNFVGTCTPIWLFEGLAMNMDELEDKKCSGQINAAYLRYSFSKEDLKESDGDAKEFYRNSYLATRLLIKKRGIRAIMGFLKNYRKHRTKKTYDVLYKKLNSMIR